MVILFIQHDNLYKSTFLHDSSIERSGKENLETIKGLL